MIRSLVLRALTGPLRGKEFTYCYPTHLVVGRSRSCSLSLPNDVTVSRQHCLVELGNDGAWVRDLSSRNGTFVNGKSIGQRPVAHNDNATMMEPAPCHLEDGDELRICSHVFAVRLYEDAGCRCPNLAASLSSSTLALN